MKIYNIHNIILDLIIKVHDLSDNGSGLRVIEIRQGNIESYEIMFSLLT